MEIDRIWLPSRTVLTASAATIRRFLDEVYAETGEYLRIEVDDAIALAEQVDI
jgi:hypothetical protein